LILLGILGHLFIIQALAIAQASDIAPFGYAGLLFAIIFGIVIFGEIPDVITLLGAIIIVSAGVYVWYRERLAEAKIKK
jgi:drug/metabolite transporter (DMT)-like permease